MFDYALHHSLLQKRNRCEPSYIKHEIANRLLSRLELMSIQPQKILVLGYADNDYIHTLQARFPQALIVKSQADTQPDSLFDLIISNSDIHLNENLHQAFEQLSKQLVPNGILLFSSFASQTLQHFARLWRRIDGNPHHNNMIDMHDWGDIIYKTSFETPVIESEIIHFDYENLNLIWQDLRQLNEPLADTKMRKTLTGKYRWVQFCALISQQPRLSFEVLYGYAKLPNTATGKSDAHGSITVSFDALKKQLFHK